MFAPDDGAGHRPDHFERHGGRDRHWRRILQRSRLRRLARLVPKQISTGDRTILGKISRRGNRYLRVLFVQAAWVVLVKTRDWERYGLKCPCCGGRMFVIETCDAGCQPRHRPTAPVVEIRIDTS